MVDDEPGASELDAGGAARRPPAVALALRTVPGKRHHYVPRFLLRRFAIDPTDRKSHIFRLEKKTGQPRRVNPTNETGPDRDARHCARWTNERPRCGLRSCFTSRFKGEAVTRTLHVTQHGLDEARRTAWAPSDDDGDDEG